MNSTYAWLWAFLTILNAKVYVQLVVASASVTGMAGVGLSFLSFFVAAVVAWTLIMFVKEIKK